MNRREELYNILKETFLLLDFGDRHLFTQFSLTAPRFYAMTHIANEPGMSLSRLSDLMFCDKSNATRIVRGLVGDGFVLRQPHETDGRSLRLFLTEEGTAVLQQVVQAHKTYNDIRLNCISETERSQLIQTLHQLNNNLRQILEESDSFQFTS